MCVIIINQKTEIKFVKVANFTYPRKQIISDLIHVVRRHPQLGKDSASLLIEVGEAIHANATPTEISVLINNIMTQEVYVRNVVLQCLQVSLSISLEFCQRCSIQKCSHSTSLTSTGRLSYG